MSVELPHGTEVVTDVGGVTDDGRRVEAGALGRVVATAPGEVVVQLVGGGRLRIDAGHVTPRRGGQLRFAERRAAAWSALRPCVVLEAVVGSRAWGVADECSDTDRRGAFVLPWTWSAGLGAPVEELVSADGSATHWEVGKLLRQALRNDPNTLELLFADGVAARDPMGEWLLAARERFPSALIYGSFARYALSQGKKLRQSARLAAHRGLVLDWLRAEPGLALDRLAARLARSTGVDDGRARDYLKQLYRSMYDQGLIASNDLAALATLAADGAAASLELPRELRPKNAYNLLRLLHTALGWLETGRPTLRVDEELAARLRAIKQGEVAIDEVLAEADALAPALEAARARTPLPQRPDVTAADALLRLIREEAARRWVREVPGPWGADAPPPPRVEWQEES